MCSVLLTSSTHRRQWRIYASEDQAGIDSDYGLAPNRRQAIIWTNCDLLSVRTIGTNFNGIWIKMQQFYSRKCIWNCCLQLGGHSVSASMCQHNMMQFGIEPAADTTNQLLEKKALCHLVCGECNQIDWIGCTMYWTQFTTTIRHYTRQSLCEIMFLCSSCVNKHYVFGWMSSVFCKIAWLTITRFRS